MYMYIIHHQGNRAIPCVLLCLMCRFALFSWSLFLDLESLPGNLRPISEIRFPQIIYEGLDLQQMKAHIANTI